MPNTNTVRIHILRCGYISVSPAVPFSAGRAFSISAAQSYYPVAGRVRLPVFSYLIEHPRGRILVDAGWTREVCPEGVFDMSAARSVLPDHLAHFFRPELPLGEGIDEQLAALSLSPSDIDIVLITHLDPDHVSGVKALLSAKRVLMAQEEYWWNCRTVYRLRQPQSLWMDYPIEQFWYKGTAIGPNRWSYDLFGDGSVRLVHLPGHTEGLFGVLIEHNFKHALICSDAAFAERSWRECIPSGFGFNPVLQKKCLQWIKTQAELPGCAAVLCSHDPLVTPHIIEL